MDYQDLELVRTWTLKEGWNPGLHDVKCFFYTDPNGYFIGRLNGEPIASGSAVIYDDSFAFCGLYIVQKDFRKNGYGLSLTQRMHEYIGSRNSGLDGVIAMVNKYKNLGYEIAHHNIRYVGQGPIQINTQIVVTPLSSIAFKEICAYDRLHFPAFREKFLKCWINQPASFSYAVLEDRKLVGYGFIRPSADGFRIGPLFANNLDIADALFTNLVQHAGSSLFFMDSPYDVNPDVKKLAQNYHLQETFKSARMYLKYEPDINIKQIYGITSLELG